MLEELPLPVNLIACHFDVLIYFWNAHYAISLCLSEVLKQVWDLSDQDNDSMLSRREFCTALFLMERYREGRPLPPVLPDSIRFDETLLRETGQPVAAYGWRPTPGIPMHSSCQSSFYLSNGSKDKKAESKREKKKN